MKHRPIENKKRYSWDSAIFLVTAGMKYLLMRYIPAASPMTFAIKLMMMIDDDACSMLLNVAIPNIRSITIKSWTINIHMLSLQEVDSISSLSPKSFKTTIVLLKANPMAKNTEVMVSNQSIVARKYPNPHVINT
ncbi:TPA: hypothetical protein DCZ39_02010 [Patescibacteria group bacterium]|nr:hypothetical protein [Candidatus Gracilibacteria bacterium]